MIGLDIILGGVTGLIGNAFTTWFKYKNKKMEVEHEENMLKLETSAMLQESEMQIQITKSRIEGEIELADADAYKQSIKGASEKLFSDKWIDMIMEAGKTKWYGWFFKFIGMFIASGFAFLDWLRSFMRPAMTLYLMGATTWITYMAWDIVEKTHGGVMTLNVAEGILTQVIHTVVYLTVSAVTWWFGDRTMSKFLQQQGKRKSGGTPDDGAPDSVF